MTALLAGGAFAVEIERAWLEGDDGLRGRLLDIQGNAAPDVLGVKWYNSKELVFAKLKGKVVVVDFWATWSKLCLAAIPRNNEIYEKYRQAGLVWIGVCSTQGAEIVEDIIRERGIKYPVCVDMTNFSDMRFAVDSYPDYYIIDKNGVIIAADCENDKVEDIVKLLLAEPYVP